MTIVICILGVLLSILNPNVRIFSFLIDHEAQKIRQELNCARQSAISNNTPYKVEFIAGLNRLRISVYNFHLSRFKILKEMMLIQGVNIAGTSLRGMPNGYIIFYPRGYADEGIPTVSGGGTISLTQGKARRYIIITPVTGRVRIDEVYPK